MAKADIHHPLNAAILAIFSGLKNERDFKHPITLTPYMVLPLFATRFADYAGGIRVPFIQPLSFNLI